ncbi:M36 family metallopeptidase [Agrilutibacter solisilvae]|uniref:M36 family metallopeptidase n=1 Tax=Agrilutibacter solisilvae TaxID=2763317 RepID=A0A974Y430_9GAMM|nr:M36 family metallopeptidase [Lysobacter solisilvae]QSX77491.1 M36 family metallopeptidase [Lysobacter solisilvae]
MTTLKRLRARSTVLYLSMVRAAGRVPVYLLTVMSTVALFTIIGLAGIARAPTVSPVMSGFKAIPGRVARANAPAPGSQVAGQLPDIDAAAEAAPLPNARATKFGEGVLAGMSGHMDEKLQVPNFAWGNADPLAIPPRSLIGNAQEQARWQLRRLASAYRMAPAEVDALRLQEEQALSAGSNLVKFKHVVNGVEIFLEEVSVLLRDDGRLVAIGGFVSGAGPMATTNPKGLFKLDAKDAVARALSNFAFDPKAVAGSLHATGHRNGYSLYQLAKGARSSNGAAVLPVHTKPVYFRVPSGLVPAYYVHTRLAGSESKPLQYYSHVISAISGDTLFRHKQEAHAQPYTYRVWAEATAPNFPFPGPGGRNGTPHPTGVPDGYQPPLIAPNLVMMQSGPISTGDPWLPDNAIYLTGNNVDAYSDLTFNDTADADAIRPDITSANAFDRTYDFTLPSDGSSDQIKAALTQLFYLTNWLHDWYYDAGFNEVGQNAQVSNYGRGGLENDGMIVNAYYNIGGGGSITLPPDGIPPAMSLHPMDVPGKSGRLSVTGQTTFTTTSVGHVRPNFMGPVNFNVAADVVPGLSGTSTRGCTALTNASEVAGKIAFLDAGTCQHRIKVKNAQNAGAIGAIIGDATSPVGGGDATVSIPLLVLQPADTTNLKAAMAAGIVTAQMEAQTEPYVRHHVLDNFVAAHEFGHLLVSRTISNGDGFNAGTFGESMAEGWADFVAMHLLAGPDPNHDYNGVYAFAPHVGGGPASPPGNQSYYFSGGAALRRYPLSTDFAKNGLTFRHFVVDAALPPRPPEPGRLPPFTSFNGDEYHRGTIWATMLWECYTSLLRDSERLTFAQAQDRMKRYLVTGLKLTPVRPNFIQGRDALLAAMLAQDTSDFELCAAAFARRGLGAGAVHPTDFAGSGLVESYGVAGGLQITSFDLDDLPGYCDRDDVLDNGETGRLMVTVRNSGLSTLTQITGTVSSPVLGVIFPQGAGFTVPSLPPVSTTTVVIPVSLSGVVGPAFVQFDATASAPGAYAPGAGSATLRLGYDEVPLSSATDDAESRHVVWSTDHIGASASNWTRIEVGPNEHRFSGSNLKVSAGTYWVSPPLNVSASGTFAFTFQERHSFDAPLWPSTYAGGVIEISNDDGATWIDIGAFATPTYDRPLMLVGESPVGQPGVLENIFGARPVYAANQSSIRTISVNLGAMYQAQTVRVRFGSLGTLNTAVISPNFGWQIDNIAFSGIDNTPFDALLDDPGPCPLQLASGPVMSWLGLKNSDAVGLRIDVLAEVLLDDQVVNSGQLNNVNTGSSGFNNALFQTIGLGSMPAEYLGNPNVAVRLSVRRTCFGAGHNSGTVRLWYNGAPIDSGASRDAGTRLNLVANGQASTRYLRSGSLLSPSAGTTKTSVDTTVNSASACPNRPFSLIGVWTGTVE